MVDLFIEPREDIINIIKKAIVKSGNILKFSKELNICRTTIYHWLTKKCWMDLQKFQKICVYLNLDWLKILKNRKVHNRRRNPETFNKEWFELTPGKSCFLGWICTEGYIPKNSCRIAISQKDITVLKKLMDIIKREYKINDKIIIREDIYKNTLEINSPMLWYSLVNYFKIPYGKKNSIVSVPNQIFNSTKECKLAFLVASIEGDGSWPPDSLNIRMTSEWYIKGCYKLFLDLEYKAIFMKLKQYNVWSVGIYSKRDICRFVRESSPYIIAIDKIENFLNKQFLSEYLYKNNYIKIDWRLIKKIKESLNLKISELSDIIKKNTGYYYKTKYISNWLGDSKCRDNLRIRLPILILFSKILKNPEIVPLEYSWIEDAYKTKKFSSIINSYDIKNDPTNKAN